MQASFNPTEGEQLIRSKARIKRLNIAIESFENQEVPDSPSITSLRKERDELKDQLKQFLNS